MYLSVKLDLFARFFLLIAHLASEHRSGTRKPAVRASLSDASYPRLMVSLRPGRLASKPDDIVPRFRAAWC